MGVAELTDLLKSGGPYTLAAICMIVTGFLYRGRENDRKEHAAALEKARKEAATQLENFRSASKEEHEEKNNKLFALAERMAAVIATTDSNQARLTELVKELLREIRERR